MRQAARAAAASPCANASAGTVPSALAAQVGVIAIRVPSAARSATNPSARSARAPAIVAGSVNAA